LIIEHSEDVSPENCVSQSTFSAYTIVTVINSVMVDALYLSFY